MIRKIRKFLDLFKFKEEEDYSEVFYWRMLDEEFKGLL